MTGVPILRRRSILRLAPALAVAGMLPGPARAQRSTPLRVGFISLIPMAQLFVIEGEGWAKDAGLSLILKRFASGPPMVEAFAMGALDIAYIGIGPALLARARGLDVKVVAANVVEQVALIGGSRLVAAFAGAPTPAVGFARFRQAAGRSARIATLPRGSVPDTVLRYYLEVVAQLDPGGAGPTGVGIVSAGEDEVQRLLLDGAVDGAAILEPILSIVLERDHASRILAWPHQMMPNHPGAVVLATSEVIAQSREQIAKLVALHIKAVGFAAANPDRATNDIVEYLGRGLVDPVVIRKALTSDATQLIADPHAIVASTRLLQEFEQRLGSPAAAVDIDSLFDFSFYDAATGRRPGP